MKCHTNLILSILLVLGCAGKQNEEATIQVADTIANSQPIDSAREENISHTDVTWVEEGVEKEDAKEDCVFNNDYKGLTIGWLKELNKSNFIWRNDLEQALIPVGQDTVFLSQGGCFHFGFLVELKLTNDNHSLSDSVYWINKALALANEYEMDQYQKMIRSGKIRKVQDGKTTVWYEVEDDNPDDNLYYNGIEITSGPTSKRLSISQYFN
jgi:hypothetical protein